ncbi:hypothetical protein [Microbacterium sp. K24]|uniref:hypothetical protein n=1 Tax=Microbacterium sp. K24 TaxID=2305446 RepID=UPI00109D11DB|nr:hypothetical protein [Microbacterium sp. K24]
MIADIQLNHTIPHGTLDGYRAGCRGSGCPAQLSCEKTHIRYQGDYGFRKALNAGITPEEYLTRERAASVTTVRTQQTASTAVTRGRVARGRQYVRKEPGVPITENQRQVLALHKDGLTDGEIAERMGKTREQINATRHHLHLKPNRAAATDDHIRTLHSKGFSDILIAKELGRNLEHVRSRRRNMKLPLNPHRPPVIVTADLRRLHGEGLTDKQIAERLDTDPRYVARRRRKLHLAPNQAPAVAGVSSS